MPTSSAIASSSNIDKAADLEPRLLGAIAKYEAQLALARSKLADFAFIWPRDVLLHLAECQLHLARMRRVAWRRAQPASTSPSLLSVPPDVLESIRLPLAAARAIYFEAEVVSKAKGFIEGQVQVLAEEAAVATLTKDNQQALSRYDQAIALCQALPDAAVERFLATKRQALLLDVHTSQHLDQLAQNSTANASERQILEEAFGRLATNGSILKQQLITLAQDLGANIPLTTSEVDLISKQIREVSPEPSASSEITFDQLWRWWVSEEIYDARVRRSQ